ncbi:hypothetical protein ACHMW5_11640 [Azospirillum melinis]|uniref:hypothetical protein n=1 Tax=Azospirillum melinis TaxID=328839 RepID=UPI003756599C
MGLPSGEAATSAWNTAAPERAAGNTADGEDLPRERRVLVLHHPQNGRRQVGRAAGATGGRHDEDGAAPPFRRHGPALGPLVLERGLDVAAGSRLAVEETDLVVVVPQAEEHDKQGDDGEDRQVPVPGEGDQRRAERYERRGRDNQDEPRTDRARHPHRPQGGRRESQDRRHDGQHEIEPRVGRQRQEATVAPGGVRLDGEQAFHQPHSRPPLRQDFAAHPDGPMERRGTDGESGYEGPEADPGFRRDGFAVEPQNDGVGNRQEDEGGDTQQSRHRLFQSMEPTGASDLLRGIVRVHGLRSGVDLERHARPEPGEGRPDQHGDEQHDAIDPIALGRGQQHLASLPGRDKRQDFPRSR